MRYPSLPAVAWPLALAIAAMLTSPLPAQPIRLEARAGAFLPTTPLGTIGVATGRLAPAPAVSAAIVFAPFLAPQFSLILTGTASVGSGTRVEPTSECLISCDAYTADAGSFRAISADVAITVPIAGLDLRAALGPSIRQYRFGDDFCACEPLQPGEMSGRSFVRDISSALAAHAGLGISRPMTRTLSWILHADAFLSESRWGEPQRDLVMSVGITF